MDNSTQNIQKGRALAGFGKVFSGIGVVILVAGVILSATPAIAAGVIIAVIGGVMGASGGKSSRVRPRADWPRTRCAQYFRKRNTCPGSIFPRKHSRLPVCPCLRRSV